MIKKFFKNVARIASNDDVVSTVKFGAKLMTVLAPTSKIAAVVSNFEKVANLLENVVPTLDAEQTKKLRDRINLDNEIAFKDFTATLLPDAYGKGNDGLNLHLKNKLGEFKFNSKTKEITNLVKNAF